jgi:[NiFe] hydrogenase diaphorase moiety large subunit
MKNSISNKLTFSKISPDSGIKAAITKTRGDVIGQVSASGIKGRGGAGFPVGVKWNLCAAARGEKKFIVCNADEGEPGTFKDRAILSDFADLVFEGMTIAGMAIGAQTGIVYLRGEYTYLLPQLEAVLSIRRDKNLLGNDILGKKGFDFDIRIQFGAGAYVCGEETALIESLEGHRGEPRNRPPFPVDTGFMNYPTVVNNVETLAWVACIMSKGAEWFREIGTEKSSGPKIFSISGDCAKPGVYEFPMGVTIKKLLEEVGGEGAKGVQVGGASGQLIPASEFNRAICYEDIPTGGSVIVFGPKRDMLEVARNFLEFFCDESCGQCTPCREGNLKLLDGVEKLLAGTCSMKYLKELVSLGETMQLASKCGLGQTSSNAFVSIMKHFKEEVMGRSTSAA